MHYFFDTEFVDTGKRIELISIGIVDDDGREYYAEVNEMVPYLIGPNCNPWIKENVIPNLDMNKDYHSPSVKSRSAIRNDITWFCSHNQPEFWAYIGAYDWVALSQLYGSFMERPAHWPDEFEELKNYRDVLASWNGKGNAATMSMRQYELVVKNDKPHNALSDARWVRDVHADLAMVHHVLQTKPALVEETDAELMAGRG